MPSGLTLCSGVSFKDGSNGRSGKVVIVTIQPSLYAKAPSRETQRHNHPLPYSGHTTKHSTARSSTLPRIRLDTLPPTPLWTTRKQ